MTNQNNNHRQNQSTGGMEFFICLLAVNLQSTKKNLYMRIA